MTTLRTPVALTQAYSDLVDAYHEVLAAHHGERGPEGCPCCAEFRPRIVDALAAVQTEIDHWETEPTA
jgi:hypothetical protein